MRPWYLLVEETNRELASRVLIGTIAANSGHDCYIIPQWFAWEHADRLPLGVFLFKGNNLAQSWRMQQARDSGHRTAAIEEEILGVTDASEILRLFHSTGTNACELFLFQGMHALELVAKKFPDARSRMLVTGNPRTDLLLPPLNAEILKKMESIKKKYGNFILINTNFASVNPRVDDTISYYEMCVRVGVVDPNSRFDQEQFFKWCTWEHQNIILLGQVIPALRALPGAPRIIIRPHPSENFDRWHEAWPDSSGVSVIREGDHAAWTAAALMLLHTGCTTGVEATLLGTPALSLQGGTSDWHRVHTSNFVNPTAGSVDAAVEWVRKVMTKGPAAGAPTPEMSAEMEHQLLPAGPGSSAHRVVAALETLTSDGSKTAGSDTLSQRFASSPLRASEHKIDSSAFSVPVIRAMVAGFATALGHAATPRVSAIGDAVIRIEGAS